MADWISASTSADGTDTVWRIWASGTSTTGGNDAIWQSWVDGSTDSSSDVVWAAWTSQDAGTTGYVDYSIGGYRQSAPAPETEEEREARLERDQQLEAARQERLKAKQEAQKKAEELLRETLEKEQLEQYEKTKWFFVISQSGVRYRIRDGWVGNIDELNELGQVVATYCIHPRQSVPVEDSMLIQKLMLEADEPRLLQIANKTTLMEPRAILA